MALSADGGRLAAWELRAAQAAAAVADADILGASGRAMLDALVQGTTDPEILAELARGRLRAKIPALKEALKGRFEPHHALVIGAILSHLDFLDEQISRLSEAIEAQLGPFAAGVELASSLTGVARRTAEVMVAEIGIDMRVFPTAGHLASWAGGVPATTDPPGNAAPDGPERAANGSGSRSKKPRSQRPAPRTPTSPPNTNGYAPGSDTAARSVP